jgi:uncharacterized protein DUF3644
MARYTRSFQLFLKSESALFAAIEIYNKPNFRYREETFSILALNAWELLLKAKILSDHSNDPRSLYVYEQRKIKGDRKSQKLYIRRNRSGTPMTKSLGGILGHLQEHPSTRLNNSVRQNLLALEEVRNSACHFYSASPELARRVLELGTASVRNYIELARRWFDQDLTSYSLYLLPIGFVATPATAAAMPASRDEHALVEYLQALVRANADDINTELAISLQINLSFQRSASGDTGAVRVTTDPAATPVRITEEDMRERYPWDYEDLCKRLSERFIDFKRNRKFYNILAPLKLDTRFAKERQLDPGNPRTQVKMRYNPNIAREFDRHYTRA